MMQSYIRKKKSYRSSKQRQRDGKRRRGNGAKKVPVLCVLGPKKRIKATLPDEKEVAIYRPKKIAEAMASVGENSLLLRASAVRGGIYYKLDISPLKPGVKGKARGFMSWKRHDGQMVYVALFRAKSGKFVLVWDNRKEFSRWSWTPVSARPTRKNKPRNPRQGFTTQNSFEPLKEPEEKVVPKKVVSKQCHFPSLQGGTRNPTSSTYNPAWGGNVRKRIEDVEKAKKAAEDAKQAAKQAAKKAALANTETDPRDRRIQIFNEDDPRGRRIQIFEEGVDEDFGYEEFDDDEYDDEYPEDEYPENEYPENEYDN